MLKSAVPDSRSASRVDGSADPTMVIFCGSGAALALGFELVLAGPDGVQLATTNPKKLRTTNTLRISDHPSH